jgi:Adenylosuccinate synthase
MCVAYEVNEKKIDYLPASVEDQIKAKPVYKSFQGWNSSTKGIKKFDELPDNAKNYIKELEKFVETKVASISTSPERNDTILIIDPFKN